MRHRNKRRNALAGFFLLGFLIFPGFFSAGVPIIDHPRAAVADVGNVDGRYALLSGFADGQAVDVNGMGERSAKLDHIRLVPGGESIGVKVNTKGVLVVGYHLIESPNGEASPGETAGIRVGDVITAIDGQQMKSIADIRKTMLQASGDQALSVTVLRRQMPLKKKIIPVRDRLGNRCRLGLYVRDSASGIGTMTFYDPRSLIYGALGHVIADRDTGQPVLIRSGRIQHSTVQAIDRGTEGKPGEKIAFFSRNAVGSGTVEKNTPFGIYGRLGNHFTGHGQSLPVASADEVREGPAKILTVLNGTKVQAFDIAILNAAGQDHPATKGLVIKVTDRKLLQATGGIIQGMSGSPIIQNGKLIGAVTHVFVNDPTCGYGVYIEWMLRETGLLETSTEWPENRAG
jgi:stage IV sporulation protein B